MRWTRYSLISCWLDTQCTPFGSSKCFYYCQVCTLANVPTVKKSLKLIRKIIDFTQQSLFWMMLLQSLKLTEIISWSLIYSVLFQIWILPRQIVSKACILSGLWHLLLDNLAPSDRNSWYSQVHKSSIKEEIFLYY